MTERAGNTWKWLEWINMSGKAGNDSNDWN